MAEDHSILSPSSAGVWAPEKGCPGSVKMRQALPPEPDDADNTIREEGTACHELAAARLKGASEPTVASNGVAIDDEMRDAVDLYVEAIHEECPGWLLWLSVEDSIRIPDVHPECFGTVDAWLIAGDTLFIWDLKYGFGYVDAFENWQLLCYACGLVTPETKRIVLTIVQPRSFGSDGPVRRWELDLGQFQYYRRRLRNAAETALSDVSFVRTGKHCKHCPARFCCDAAIKAGADLYEATADPVPQDATPFQLAGRLNVIKRAAEHLGYLETALSEQLKQILKSGQSVPGYRLISKPGRLEWDRPAEEVIAAGRLCGLDLARPSEPITPTQAKKAGLPESLVSHYASRKLSGLELVPQSEKSITKLFEK